MFFLFYTMHEAGFIFSLRNFDQMSKLGRNFSIISELIDSVVSIMASMILGLKSKILLTFPVISTELVTSFTKNLGQ